jgi:hypothetical protein
MEQNYKEAIYRMQMDTEQQIDVMSAQKDRERREAKQRLINKKERERRELKETWRRRYELLADKARYEKEQLNQQLATEKQTIAKNLLEIKEKEKRQVEQEIKNTAEKEKQRIIKDLQNSRAKEIALLQEKSKMEEIVKELQKKQGKGNDDKPNNSQPTTTKQSKGTKPDNTKPNTKIPKTEGNTSLLDPKWLYENENDVKNMNNESIAIEVAKQAREIERLKRLHRAAKKESKKDPNPSGPSSGSDSDDDDGNKDGQRKSNKKDEGENKKPPNKGKDEGGYEGDKESGRHSRTARSTASNRDEKEFLKLSFLNNAIPTFDPHARITKHYQFLQICNDYLNDPNVKKADWMSVILAKLPADDRDWFRKWFAKGKYDTFIEAFRRKYVVTISFAEFNRHLDEFRFDENQGAIKNGRRLRAYATPLLALLPNDIDRQRAEITILEKFRNCLSSTECIQINMEAPNRVEPTNLNDYLELIDQLEGRTNTVVQI